MVVALWVIVTVTFVLVHAIPGGPFDSEKKLPDAIKRNIEARYRLDQPKFKQYQDYLAHLLRWDLGPSFKYESRSVNDIIHTAFPVSAILGLLSVSLSLAIGLPAGIISALKHNKWQDTTAMFGSIVGVSVPSFILASFLMYAFSLKLGWLPPARWGTPQQAILPTIALASFSLAFVARLTRSSMLDVVSQDYIRTAHSKGLPQMVIIYRHALKNALIPVVTYLGPLVAGVLTGSFVIEHIFAIPGLGRHYVQSIHNRDYTVILGVTVFYSILLLAMNFLVDVAYVLLDPRISYLEERR